MPKKTAGERLRSEIQAELDERELELDKREQAFLERAVSCADDIEALEGVVAKDGHTLTEKGRVVVHPAVGEIRRLRQLLHRFLNSLDLEGRGQAASASSRGRKAANARWGGRGR